MRHTAERLDGLAERRVTLCREICAHVSDPERVPMLAAPLAQSDPTALAAAGGLGVRNPGEADNLGIDVMLALAQMRTAQPRTPLSPYDAALTQRLIESAEQGLMDLRLSELRAQMQRTGHSRLRRRPSPNEPGQL